MIKAILLSDAVLAASAGSLVYISEGQLKALGDKAKIVNEAEVNEEPKPVIQPKEEPKEEKPRTRKTIKKK